MAGTIFELASICLIFVSLFILAFLLFSKHRHRITLVGFWKNILVLLIILLAGKIAVFFDYSFFGDVLFVVFSFLVMVLMVVTFVLNYGSEDSFEFKLRKVK